MHQHYHYGEQVYRTRENAVGLPKGLDLVRSGPYLQMVYKWFGWHTVYLSVFVVIWDGILFVLYSGMGAIADPMALLLPSVHVVAGIGMTYFAIAGWFNRTYIRVGHGMLEVFHRPIPWIGNKTLPATEVQQLFVKDHVAYRNRIRTVTFEVHAVTYARKTIKLVRGLASSVQALWIEPEAEKYLGMKNISVKREFNRYSFDLVAQKIHKTRLGPLTKTSWSTNRTPAKDR